MVTVEEDIRTATPPVELRSEEQALIGVINNPSTDSAIRKLAIDCMCAMARRNGIRRMFPDAVHLPDRKVAILLDAIFAERPDAKTTN